MTRPMTEAEALIARELASRKFPLGRHKMAIHRLRAESFKADRAITDDEAALLRSHVTAFKSRLPETIVKMAEGR